MDSKKLAFKLAELALSKKAEDIKILDLRKITPIADFFVICTANSEPQVKAIANEILVGAKKEGETVWHKEGTNMKSWVLLDFIDVVVHVFLRDTRGFYSLEKLWGDAEITDITDEAPQGKLAKKTKVPKVIKPKAVKKSPAKAKSKRVKKR
ncbi:MAG: ribosome silencing factor [Ignavibacteria bacterium]